MDQYKFLVEKGIEDIVNWKWHKIITMDEGEERYQFLKNVCDGSHIIPNFGQNQCCGIYIKDSGLSTATIDESNSSALRIISRDYYDLLLVRSIFIEILNQVADKKLLKTILDEMKRALSFKGDSFEDLLVAFNTSIEMVKSSYEELVKTGSVTNVYIGNLPIDMSSIYGIERIIDKLHRCLGNSYSNFALIIDADNNLSAVSKKAINEYIFSRTTGYKINVICERRVITHKSPIDEEEIITTYVPNWNRSTFSGNIIENPHDYSYRDYTDRLKEACLKIEKKEKVKKI